MEPACDLLGAVTQAGQGNDIALARAELFPQPNGGFFPLILVQAGGHQFRDQLIFRTALLLG